MVRWLLVWSLFLFHIHASSQSATGAWYGRADIQKSGTYSNYLTELILKQKGDEVEGIFGYYFKDSYQSFFIRGTYDKETRMVSIRNLPLIHYGSSGRNGIECPMHFQGTLLVSRASSSLNGYFYSDERYKYTCPELRVSFQMNAAESNADSLLRNTAVGKKMWQPHEEDFVLASPAGTDSNRIAADIIPGSHQGTAPPTGQIKEDLVRKFENRANTYQKDLEVEGDSLRISFYDNGDIDGDSISVFLNREPVLVKQELTARSLNIYLALDPKKEVNEISMLAENLGLYPPNTALMVVSDGVHRYEVYLSSSLTQNATVRIRKIRKK